MQFFQQIRSMVSPARVFAVGLLFSVLVFSGQSCGGEALAPPAPLTLKVWRSEDTQEDFTAAMAAYTSQYPHVGFEYRVFAPDEYEQALLSAWARGEGPDIFSIPNIEVGQYQQYITPMPASVSLARSYTQRSFGRTRTIVESVDTQLLAPSQLRDRYTQVVASDVLLDNKIYGLPLAVDSLVMYYNRDLLSKAQIAVPPATWEEFRNAVQSVTKRSDDNQTILQSAASLGTANNVPYFFDIVSVIMMQNGTQMVTPSGEVAFAQEVNGSLRGAETVDFYTKFATPDFATYTWTAEESDGRSAFIDGRTAFFFGYGRDKQIIEQQSPNLNFSFAALPQIDPNNRVDYASYAVEAVHLGSAHPEHAWNFIHSFATTDEARAFADATGRVPARLSDIGQLREDPDRGVFVQSSLTARSWYHGQDPVAAVSAFAEMVNETIAKTTPIEEIVNTAAEKVALTWQKATE